MISYLSLRTSHLPSLSFSLPSHIHFREKLSLCWDSLILLEELNSHDTTNLALLGRPELGVTFTKINAWKLEEYSKCVFLDADTLVLVNVDELFEREELSAAPDCGWPDCFNSGVFVFVPSTETYKNLLALAQQMGSFDGGDQGLLNTYWSQWATSDIKYHLPFVYNMTANAGYTYKPALRRFGSGAKIVHFIGAVKPWHARAESAAFDFLDRWKEVHKKAVAPFSSAHSSNMLHPICPSTAHAGVQFAPVPHLPPHLHQPQHRLRSPPPPLRTVTRPGEEGGVAVVPFGHVAMCTPDEETRRRNFEEGRIDYTGTDRFDLLIQPCLDACIMVQDELEVMSGRDSVDFSAVPSSEDPMLQDVNVSGDLDQNVLIPEREDLDEESVGEVSN